MQQQPGGPSSLKGGVMSRGACEVSAGVRDTSAGSPRRTDRGWPLGSPRRYIKTVRTGAQHGGGAGQQGGDGTPRGVWCVGCRSCGAAFSLRGTTHSLVVPRHPTHTPLVDGSRLWNGRSVYVKLSVNHSLQWRVAAGLRCAICWAPRGGGGCSGAAGSSPGGPRPEGGVYIYRRMNSSSICEDWRGPQRPS